MNAPSAQTAKPIAVRYLKDICFFNGLADIKAGEQVRISQRLAKDAAWVVRDNGDTWAEVGIDGVRAEWVFPSDEISKMKNSTTEKSMQPNLWPADLKTQKRIAAQVARDAVPRAGRNDNGRYHECFEVCGYSLIVGGNTKEELRRAVIEKLMNGRPCSN